MVEGEERPGNVNREVSMDEADKELENYRALLRRQEQNWQARFESVLHSDRAAVDIGLLAVRTAILMNAGASVALGNAGLSGTICSPAK